MKNPFGKLAFIIYIVSFWGVVEFASCNGESPKTPLEDKTAKLGEAAKDVAVEIKNSTKETLNDASDSRDSLKIQIQKGVATINSKIKDIDAKMATGTREQKANWEKQKIELNKNKQTLDRKLTELGAGMKEGWEAFKGDVSDALDKVKHDINQ